MERYADTKISVVHVCDSSVWLHLYRAGRLYAPEAEEQEMRHAV